MSDEIKPSLRQRTLLRGTIYYDNRSVSVDCLIRDMSETGARITFDRPVVVPDDIELYIPQKQQWFRSHVRRREFNEIGVQFEVERSGEARRASDADMAQRVATLEGEVKALRRIVAKLAAKVLPHDLDVG